MTTVAPQRHTTKASSTSQVRTVLLTAIAYFMVTLDALVVVTRASVHSQELRRRHCDAAVDCERADDRLRRRHPDRCCPR